MTRKGCSALARRLAYAISHKSPSHRFGVSGRTRRWPDFMAIQSWIGLSSNSSRFSMPRWPSLQQQSSHRHAAARRPCSVQANWRLCSRQSAQGLRSHQPRNGSAFHRRNPGSSGSIWQPSASQDPVHAFVLGGTGGMDCLLYTSPSPRDATLSRMPSSA